MKKNKFVINLYSLCYFAIALLVIKAALYPSAYFKYPKFVDGIIEFIAYSIWLLTIGFSKFTKQRLILFFVGITCILTCILTGSFIIFGSFLFFYVAILLENDKIVKIIYKCIVIVVFIHFGIFLINYFKGIEIPWDDLNGRIRYSIGFNHPNRASFLVAWGFLGFCYSTNSFKKKIIAFVCVLLFFYFTDSRTLLYVGIIYMFLELFKNYKFVKKIYINMPKYVYLFILLFTVCAVLAYSNNWKFGTFIDKISNQRIYYSARAYEIYGTTLFGRTIELRTNLYGKNSFDWLILDNWYMYCVYGYGIIYWIYLFFICYFIPKLNNVNKSLLITMWCIYAFFELSNMNFIIAFAPILASDCFKKIIHKSD